MIRSPTAPSEPGGLALRSLVLLGPLLLGLAACGGGSSGGPARAIPASAIEIGEELYMVPVGEDASGCTRYNLIARERETVQAVFYRDARGDFTTNRVDAGCV